MIKSRLINAPLYIEYSRLHDNFEYFKSEFDLLSESNDDPIGSWLKNMKARGKVVDETEPVIHLLIELYRKVEVIESRLSNKTNNYIPLDHSCNLDSIGHNILVFSDNSLESGCSYYSRLDIPVFPARKMPFFFNAIDSNVAEITLMHSRDVVDFDNYIASRERSIIREKKTKNKI